MPFGLMSYVLTPPTVRQKEILRHGNPEMKEIEPDKEIKNFFKIAKLSRGFPGLGLTKLFFSSSLLLNQSKLERQNFFQASLMIESEAKG